VVEEEEPLSQTPAVARLINSLVAGVEVSDMISKPCKAILTILIIAKDPGRVGATEEVAEVWERSRAGVHSSTSGGRRSPNIWN